MKNPERNTLVLAWWDPPMIGRWVKAKWTGKRWLRFNEILGGFDPCVILPSKWMPLDLTVTITGKDQKDSIVNLSWILRGFLAGVSESYLPGATARYNAAELVKSIIGSIADEETQNKIYGDCKSYLESLG